MSNELECEEQGHQQVATAHSPNVTVESEGDPVLNMEVTITRERFARLWALAGKDFAMQRRWSERNTEDCVRCSRSRSHVVCVPRENRAGCTACTASRKVCSRKEHCAVKYIVRKTGVSRAWALSKVKEGWGKITRSTGSTVEYQSGDFGKQAQGLSWIQKFKEQAFLLEHCLPSSSSSSPTGSNVAGGPDPITSPRSVSLSLPFSTSSHPSLPTLDAPSHQDAQKQEHCISQDEAMTLNALQQRVDDMTEGEVLHQIEVESTPNCLEQRTKDWMVEQKGTEAKDSEIKDLQRQLHELRDQRAHESQEFQSRMEALQQDLEVARSDLVAAIQQGEEYRTFYERYGGLDIEALLILKRVNTDWETLVSQLESGTSFSKGTVVGLRKGVQELKQRQREGCPIKSQERRIPLLRRALLDEARYAESLKNDAIALQANLSPGIMNVFALVDGDRASIPPQTRLEHIRKLVEGMQEALQKDMAAPSKLLRPNFVSPLPQGVGIQPDSRWDKDEVLVKELEEKARLKLEEESVESWKRDRDEFEGAEGNSSGRSSRRRRSSLGAS